MPNERGHKGWVGGDWISLLDLINWGEAGGGANKRRRGGQNFKTSVNIGNEWKKRHKCLILMLNLKVSKQTRNLVRLR